MAISNNARPVKFVMLLVITRNTSQTKEVLIAALVQKDTKSCADGTLKGKSVCLNFVDTAYNRRVT